MASILTSFAPAGRSPAAALQAIEWRGILAAVVHGELLGQVGLAAATLAWVAIWSQAKTRQDAFGVALLFFLVAGREAPWMVTSIGQGAIFGTTIWVAHGALLALPWALLHPHMAHRPKLALRAAAALALTLLVPPWALVQWGHPILAAGELFPGSGWAGLATAFALAAALAVLARGAAPSWAVALVGFAAALALTSHVHYKAPAPAAGWVAVDTDRRTDRAEACSTASLAASTALMTLARQQLAAGAKVVVFPEGAAGIWTLCEAYWWRDVDALAFDLGATVLVGALRPDCLDAATKCLGKDEAHRTSYSNSLIALGAAAGIINARVPIPFLSWHPWSPGGHVRGSSGHGLHTVRGRQAAVLFCYEEMIPSLALATFIGPRPDVLVAVANHWWARPGMTRPATQARFSQTLARLFGVPLLRATNLPGPA